MECQISPYGQQVAQRNFNYALDNPQEQPMQMFQDNQLELYSSFGEISTAEYVQWNKGCMIFVSGQGLQLQEASKNMIGRNNTILNNVIARINKIQDKSLEIIDNGEISESEKREKLKTIQITVSNTLDTCQLTLDMSYGTFEREREGINEAIRAFAQQCFEVIKGLLEIRKEIGLIQIEEKEKMINQGITWGQFQQKQRMELVEFKNSQERIQKEFDVKQVEYEKRYNQELEQAGLNAADIIENKRLANKNIEEKERREFQLINMKLEADLVNIKDDKERDHAMKMAHMDRNRINEERDARYAHELHQLNIQAANKKGKHAHAENLQKIGNEFQLEKANKNNEVELAKINAEQKIQMAHAEVQKPQREPEKPQVRVVRQRRGCSIM